MLSLVWVVLAVEMLILQLTRNRAGIAAADVLHGGVDRHIGGVGLRRVADQDHRVRQRDPRFRQADRLGDIDAGFHDRDQLRIGEPDVLAGADHQSAAGRGQVAGFEKPAEIVNGGVGIGAAHTFLKGGNDIVMLVAVLVVAHGAALNKLLDRLERDVLLAVFLVGGDRRQLQGIHRLAHVAAAAGGDLGGAAFFQGNGNALFLPQQLCGSVNGAFHLGRRHALELKDRRAAEDRVVNIEIRILGGGGDQGDAAVFNVFKEHLLLLFIEILDLVQIEQDAVHAGKGVQLGDDRLDISGRSGGAVEFFKRFIRFVCDIGRQRGLADAGRTVENQIRHDAALDYLAQGLAGAEQVLLPDDIVERRRTETVSQRLHNITSDWFR